MGRCLLTMLIPILLVACGSGSTTSTTEASPTAITTVAETTSTEAAVSTQPATTMTVGAGSMVDVTVTGGVVDGPDLFEYALGDQVEITVLTDVADEIHVHGYDVMYEAEPGVPVEISFEADAQGIFEVELEESQLLLFEIQVTP